jgi:hypothetical protein
MLDNLLRSLPKGVLAFIAIIVGSILILFNDPPRTVCDVQLDLFKSSEQNFLFESEKNNVKRPADITGLMQTCRNANAPGGCTELFSGFKRLTEDLRNIPSSCAETAGQVSEIKKWAWEGLRLYVEIAWGEKPPENFGSKMSWLNSADMAVFCDLKMRVIEIYGQDKFLEFQEALMKELPQANTLSREQVWELSILSSRCEAFR